MHLHYYRWGNGPKILLALHGYGLDALSFYSFEELKSQYTVYSVDLPYHGKSFWNSAQPLSQAIWRQAIETWKFRHKISQYAILGFSMGGKFALCTLDFDSKNIEKLILIAPDGVTKNFWYSAATNNAASRFLFNKLALKEGYFERFASYLERIKIVPKMTIKFAKTQMGNRSQRERAFKVWTNFRHFYGPIPKRLKLIQQHQINVLLITGKYDKVIQKKDVSELNKLPSSLFTWIELECGHTNLLPLLISTQFTFSK